MRNGPGLATQWLPGAVTHYALRIAVRLSGPRRRLVFRAVLLHRVLRLHLRDGDLERGAHLRDALAERAHLDLVAATAAARRGEQHLRDLVRDHPVLGLELRRERRRDALERGMQR